MSTPAKLLLAGGGVVVALLLALLILPLFFIDEVEARVRAEIEQASQVRVTWSDVGLGFFRDFPHPTLTLSDLDVVGTGRFEGDTLASVRDFRLSLGGPSLIAAMRGRGPLEIRSVQVDEPTVRLQVDEDGTTSWNVLPEGTDTGDEASGRDVTVSLRSFEMSDADIVLENRESGLFASARGLDQSLRGDFSRASLMAQTQMSADTVNLRLGGAPYLSDVALDFDAVFEVDVSEQRARLTENELRLNDLVVHLNGELIRQGEDLGMDLTFGAPSTSFEQILSLLPVVYSRDFASLETSGSFSLEGSIEGAYGETAFPSFALALEVVDGRFRYPDAPLPVQAIAADLAITNPGGHIDSTVVDLSRLHFEIGDQPLDAALTLRTPVSDPDVDVRVAGTIDLNDAARALELEDAEGIGGLVVADATVRARRSDVDSARWDRVSAEGTITAQNVTLRGEELRQPVDIERASISLTPQTAELQAFDARMGSSDVQATGRLDNLLGYALGGQPLVGTGSFTSDRVVLDEWKSGDDVVAIPVPAMLDLTLDGTITELAYDGLEMTNASGRAIVRDQRLTLEGFTLETLGGRIGLDGHYETLEAQRPTFALDVVMDSVDVAGASEAFLTVRTLAPVARYARGTFSTDLSLAGALGQDLSPVLDVLDGDGSLSTSRVAIEGFPLFDRLAESLELQRFSNPTVDALRSTIQIEDGRLRVNPFQVDVAGLAMSVSGSNGIDQSLDYTLALQVPRSGLADAALTSLASGAGPLGTRLAALDPVPVSVRVTGSVSQPSLALSLSEATGSLRSAVTQSAEEAVAERIDEAQQRLDASEEEARQRAQARADSIVAEAQRRADAVRAEASRAAAEVRAQGDRAAEELLARANNPLARAAAQPAADRLRQEAEERATAIEREADERATALVAEAEARAAALLGGGGGVRPQPVP